MRRIVLLFVCIIISAACSQDAVYKELSARLAIDGKVVVVSADELTDTVHVSSNRSWSAVRDGEESWLHIVSGEHLNLSGMEESSPFIFKVDANMLKSDRTASVRINGESGSRTLVITQSAIVYRLSVEGPHSFIDIPDTGDTITVRILCNTQWTASVAEGSTAKVSFADPVGEGDSELKIIIDSHTDRNEGKTAMVTISAEDCEPVSLLIEQNASLPFVRHAVPEMERWVDPEVFSAVASTRSFNIISNCKWTAAIDPSLTTASGVELSASAGDGNLDNFQVTVKGTNTDMDNEKTVAIVFTPEDGAPYTVKMRQRKGSIITLEFRDQDNTGAKWIFDEPEEAGKIGEGVLHIGGYAFGYKANGYCQLHAASGWQLGTGEDIWVEFPAIQGRKLSRISFREYNANTNPSIVDSKLSVIPGGDPVGFKRNELTSFYLSGTAENTSYRIKSNANKTFRFTLIELEYN